ncbi:hypothetical protein IV102_28410 [bacterium]|nr:hypothetical protein [bacterium]
MSWEGGVDLVALTGAATAPNIIVHLARMVHTPQGSAPSGMVLYQPDPEAAPAVIGFVSHDSKVGGYFGPNIFADTPFEKAPVLSSVIEIESDFPRKVTSRVKVAEHLLEVEMFNFQEMTLIHRAPAAMPPFWQQGVEAIPERVTLKVNGEEVPLTLPPVGISGGHPVVWSPHGIYAR